MATNTSTPITDKEKNLEEAKRNFAEAKKKLAEAKKAMRKKERKLKESLRKNNEMDDAHLAEKSRAWHKLFLDNVAAFNAFDGHFDNTYATLWLNKIKAFEAHFSDETMLDKLEGKSETLDEKVRDLLKLTDDLEYFARGAFPNSERRVAEFGFDLLRKPVANYSGYLALMSYTTVRVATDYAAELSTAGMPGGLFAAINSSKDALAEAEVNQEYGKRLRMRATTDRIKMFNELWDIHVRVHKAAKIVYRDDKEMAEVFG